MRDAVRVFLISACFLLLASPSVYGSTAFAYLSATVQLVIVLAALVLTWETFDARAENSHASEWIPAVVVAVIAGAIVFQASGTWLREILSYPSDTRRPDMVPIVERGVHQILQGKNPYTTYYIPWKTTLSYGPVLWGPYVLPYVLHADLRIGSLLGSLFVPTACALCAAVSAFQKRFISTVAWLGMLWILASSSQLREFASYAHTPIYWPLIALFAWFVGRERWTPAAITCGLLVAARTTMIAIVPVFLICVWHRDRSRTLTLVVLVVLSALFPFLPFAIWNWSTLQYSMYGAYETVIKTAVWGNGGGTDTVGLTGLLLRLGWQSYVEAAQAVVLIAVYVAAWIALGRGRRALPWMVVALFAFCATTLWPVYYIYLDVFVLAICVAMAETDWLLSHRPGRVWLLAAAVSVAVLGVTIVRNVPRDTTIDVGTQTDRHWLYAGFADNEDNGRTFAWVDGKAAEVLLPRRSRADAAVDIVCQPNLPTADAEQTMSVVLNGTVLGTVSLREGWQTVSLDAPARTWLIGLNDLTLSFSHAISPLEARLSADPRKLSVAFDRIDVRTK
ncbi:MAG TPA: hypothetical protein VH583_17315 [Vicinamibacterales bacterium]